MTKKFVNVLFIATLGAFVVSCASQKPAPPPSPFTAQDLNAKLSAYEQKVDNFAVLVDASSSMDDRYKGQKKSDIAREIVGRMNQTIPRLDLDAGLRTVNGMHTKLVYGPTEYSKGSFEDAVQIRQVVQGSSPLHRGIDAVSADLQASQGDIAVIIVSDGVEDVGMGQATVQAAADMKSRYGERLCIDTVQVGDDPKGKALLEQIAAAGACGFATNADAIAAAPAMGDYVSRIFLAKLPEPEPVAVTPEPEPVVTAPADNDGDGVLDASDKCPRTPKGAEVNLVGCWVLADVRFDTDKWQVKAEHYDVLERAYRVLAQNPNLRFEVQGHTDNVGTADYNQALSQRRAISVKQYLVEKGITPTRLSSGGYGLTEPIDTNTTGDGRARNRRVQLDRLQ